MIESSWKKVVLVDHSEILFQKKTSKMAFLIFLFTNPYKNLDLYFFAEKTTKASEVQKNLGKILSLQNDKQFGEKDFFKYIIGSFSKRWFSNRYQSYTRIGKGKTNYNLYLLNKGITKIKLFQSKMIKI
ncbi:hypothetical protein ACEW7V_00120 [Areca yellow leaf disease phytoplasma]|uniref:hypothetical protein n=1 Tax=Areca yellow leaf disease phytoplasma TaxID=927614 RepID=UPI0035B519FD